ncbi:hypothetical protein [Streptomyces sp. URMC 123]|uniref:hypothetical protein n=1 Tax=Streptomyces sp. URMC 123 TaxID=3423403 RepID=UPI003F1C1C17
MITNTKLAGRTVVASCLPGALAFRGTGVSGGADVRHVERGTVAIIDRPVQAPVAAMGQAHAYAPPAPGADLQLKWTNGAFLATGLSSAAEQYFTMRAFRGLEPWRDPA